MAALPPYLFSNQVKHKASTFVLPSMVTPASKNRRRENKTDTKQNRTNQNKTCIDANVAVSKIML